MGDWIFMLKKKSYVEKKFICLIQKKEDAVQVWDFRPISLTTLTYKLIAKVLAEYLKRVMSSIIALHKVCLLKEDKYWTQSL